MIEIETSEGLMLLHLVHIEALFMNKSKSQPVKVVWIAMASGHEIETVYNSLEVIKKVMGMTKLNLVQR